MSSLLILLMMMLSTISVVISLGMIVKEFVFLMKRQKIIDSVIGKNMSNQKNDWDEFVWKIAIGASVLIILALMFIPSS